MKKSHASNAHAAITKHLAGHSVELDTAEHDEKSGETRITGRVWHAATIPGFDRLGPINVELPVRGRVKVGQNGKVETIALSKPSPEDIEEARNYAASLAVHGDIEGVTGKAAPAGPSTHRIEEGPDGQRRLRRKGFSAV
jgi:hypothetical protein